MIIRHINIPSVSNFNDIKKQQFNRRHLKYESSDDA